MPFSGRVSAVSARQRSSRLIVSPDETSDGGEQISFRDKMNGDRELAVVTGTSSTATKGETCNPRDYDQTLCGFTFLSPPDEDGDYTGGITIGPALRFRQCVVGEEGRHETGKARWQLRRVRGKTRSCFQVSKLLKYGCMTAVETRSRPTVRDGNLRTNPSSSQATFAVAPSQLTRR